MSVSEAMEQYLRDNPHAATDPIAAAAVSLALELDRSGDAQVASAFLKLMSELRRLAPVEEVEDKVAQLSDARKRKLRVAGT